MRMSKAGDERLSDMAWDTAAIVIVGLTLIALAYIILIGLDPASPLNVFPPPTTVMIMRIPTVTQGPPPTPPAISVRPRSNTPSPSSTPGPTPTPGYTPTSTSQPLTTAALPTPSLMATNTSPTSTLQPTPPTSQTTRLPSVTPTPSPTHAPFAFTASINYQVHPVLTCEWTGLAGTTVDLKGEAARGYVVRVTGADGLSQQVAIGTSPDYGLGGWEFRLGGREAKGTWRVQLYKTADPKTPMSASYEIVLPGSCQQNLAFVRFQQDH